MEVKHSDSNKAIIVATVIFSLVLLGVLSSYAYFILDLGSNTNEELSTTTGNLSLTFADGNSGITETLEFGGSIEKTFSITNDGTLDAVAKINFEDLINTYTEGSLTYSLSSSETENGEYTEIINNENVPRSETSTTMDLIDGLEIQASKTVFYKLIIKLNYLDDVDQTADLKAMFSSHFSIEEGKGNLETTLKKLNIVASETDPNFNNGSPKNIYKEGGYYESSNYADSISSMYFTYSSSYKFDEQTGKYSLINPQVCQYKSCYTTLKNKYVTLITGTSTNTKTNYQNLSSIWKVASNTSASRLYVNSTKISTLENKEYSETGIYSAPDEYGTSYYYRGVIDNNYVKFGKWQSDEYYGSNEKNTSFKLFSSLEECENNITFNNNCTAMKGKDMYWKIVRVNGNGSIRLIYDGIRENSKKILDSIGSESVSFSSNRASGYMYGPSDDTIENVQKNKVSSGSKKALDSWYETNLLGNYSNYISDEIFCNDRSIPGPSVTKWTRDTGLGIKSQVTAYGFIGRYLTGNNSDVLAWKTNPTPTLICPQTNDKFTVNNDLGNKNLTYPIGLITADEIVLAGGRYMTENSDFYLSEIGTLTMTPASYMFSNNGSVFEFFVLNLNGYLQTSKSGSIVPVINLTPDYVLSLRGTGTFDDPYVGK